MKEYIKPEVEYIKFDSESVTSSAGNGNTDVVSLEQPVTPPDWGN